MRDSDMELGHEEEEDEDEVLDGDNLAEDIAGVLNSPQFSSPGYFYHAALQPSAPNPCLQIAGLGVVGLPLNAREILALTSNAHPLPLQEAEKMTMDEKGPDIWEIEPDRIGFGNPMWKKWIEGVCKEASARLGVKIEGGRVPRLILRKLLLCGKGSDLFLSKDSNHTANGAFATVAIILPSEYTGGEIEVSHSTTTRNINFSSDSLSSTALLTWYKGVKYETKPVTSGYRLALEYDLVHPAVDFVHPVLPNYLDVADQLQQILSKWHMDKYTYHPPDPYLVYVLKKNYGHEALKQGEMCLQGLDRQRVAVIRDAGERLGFLVWLATVEHYEYGVCEQDEHEFLLSEKRRRIGDSEDGEEESEGNKPTDGVFIEEFSDEATHIEGLVDLDGNPFVGFDKIWVKDEYLIPGNSFEDMTPTIREYDPNGSVGRGLLECRYRRTVLVLVHKDRKDDVLWSGGGVTYVLEQLKKSTVPPSPSDKQWVMRILDNLGTSYNDLQLEHHQQQELMTYALNWNDANMWKSLMEKSKVCLNIGVDDLVSACKMFGFEVVRRSFENILACSDVVGVLKFVYCLPGFVSDDRDVPLTWCREQSDKALSSCPPGDGEPCASVVLQALHEAGIESFMKLMLPNLLKNPYNYQFWFSLATKLRENRQKVIERQMEILGRPPLQAHCSTARNSVGDARTSIWPSPNLGPSQKAIDELIEKCLEMAASLWVVPIPPQPLTSSWSGPSHTKSKNGPHHVVPVEKAPQVQVRTVDRIIEIVGEAIIGGHHDICRKLFVEILTKPGPSKSKFTELYIPLVCRICDLLRKRDHDIISPPFIDLMQVLIATYLRDILGSKTELRNYRLRRMGCGCDQCDELDKFALDLSQNRQIFRMPQPRRDHFENLLASASDLCTFKTIKTGTPYGLQVTKRPEIQHASTWDGRVEEATAFLRTIGPDEVIAKIMGVRYEDVKDAMAGVRPFATGASASTT